MKKYFIKDTTNADDWYLAQEWCTEHFGPENSYDPDDITWGWVGGGDDVNTHYFWFVNEKDAVFFALKWS